jgi:Zn-dependent M28 family amino/carboxypeptidase
MARKSNMRKRTLGVTTIIAAMLAVSSLEAQVSKTPSQLGPPPASREAQKEIPVDPAKIRAHVKFLSSDLLEGRGTGQRGGDIAADYIATQFALYGLKPAGDQGTYFQNVPMVAVKTLEGTSFNFVAPDVGVMTLKNLEDFVTSNESQTEAAFIDAPIVFVGYGIRAPEYNWDDYKNADLTGKVALLFLNEPPSDNPKFFKGKALSYYGGAAYKFEETARRGAIATLVIHRADLAGYSWDVLRNSWGKERSYLQRDSKAKLRAASWIQSEAARNLVAMAGLDLDKLFEEAQSKDFQPVELPVRLQARVASQVRPFVGKNVLAVLLSRGPGATEAVLYSAHYDHLGVDPDRSGHNIYNGAVDNATGCAVLLELARTWSETTKMPLRMILFAALTAEDQGLLGSEYLAMHSPVAPGKISLDLSFDTLKSIGDPEEVVVPGAERTTFYPAVEETAKTLGLTIRPEARPEGGFCYRSDRFNLARVGIPSFSISEGLKFKGHDEAWGEAQEHDYLEHRYHQPTDQFLPGMDFTGDAKLATFGYELGAQAASQVKLVGWLPGDEFDVVRKESQPFERKAAPPRKKTPPHK